MKKQKKGGSLHAKAQPLPKRMFVESRDEADCPKTGGEPLRWGTMGGNTKKKKKGMIYTWKTNMAADEK